MVVIRNSKGKDKNMRGGAIGGNYVFTKDNDELYFFSDLEGNMPDGIKELMFETTTETNGKKIFEMDATGIIEKPKSLENKVIVFTGDLIDRGEYSIRNLKRMLALKECNMRRVILLCGNRDTNKIRMYRECHIQAIEDNIFNNKNIKNIDEILTILKLIPIKDPITEPIKDPITEPIKDPITEPITDPIKDPITEPITEPITDPIKNPIKDTTTTDLFTNTSEDIAKIINIQGIFDPKKDFAKIYTNDISRIKGMYSDTLGSPKQVENFKKEFEVLFGIKGKEGKEGNELDDEETLLKFVAMMNMVMGKIWVEGVLPKILDPYNGLYIKYLQQCHIMASITIGDKLCFVSHAGIPYKNSDDIKAGTFYIPEKIGDISQPFFIKKGINRYGYSEGFYTTAHYYLKGNINILNQDFTDFINSISRGYRANEEDDKYYTYKKYVAMSANCDIAKIGDIEYSAYASPIVSRKNIDEVKNIKNLILNKLKTKGTIIGKVYNIFGHQPSGLLPYISKIVNNDITSYHIDLDISRAEDNDYSNKESYVYLKITKDTDSLFGKTISAKKGNIQIGSKIEINYDNLDLDTYCNSVREYNIKKDGSLLSSTFTFFTVDNSLYYGMVGFTLVETQKQETIIISGGRHKPTKIYTKSIKRFLYGKRKMVIYVGKRGGEYVKVKGEYMSLAKFIKTIKNK